MFSFPMTRIALFWDTSALLGQRIQAGVYQAADGESGLVVRRFESTEVDFQKRVSQPLRQWKPEGVVVYSGEPVQVGKLRKALTGIPFVATTRLPASLVDTTVGSNWEEVFTLCRDTFRDRGVPTMALFSVGNPVAAKSSRETLLKLVPDAHIFSERMDLEVLVRAPQGKWLRTVGQWLKQLPKPVGIYSLEIQACGYLSGVCRKLRLKIPYDVQLIGPDDVDGCLACDPPLTSIVLPAEAIGRTAMKILLARIRRAPQAGGPLMLVSGATLIERGSTSALPLGGKTANKVLNVVRSEATRGLTAMELVRRSNVSTRTFYKEFRAATDETPARLLRQMRLDEACRLLRDTSSSMEQIVEKCGFSSPSYFSQVFRRTLGMSPTEYRQSHKNWKGPCEKSTVVEVAWDGVYTQDLTELPKHLTIEIVK
jgi:LacI family transcriptional regulator